jgi:hypothetical protein
MPTDKEVWLRVEHQRGRVAKFDPTDGSFEIKDRWIPETDGAFRTNGWMLMEGDSASAVYSDGHTMFFQNGNQRYDLGNPEIRLEVRYGKGEELNLFRIMRKGYLVFEKPYELPTVPFDPTWDDIDQGSLDFYYRMSDCMKSPQWVREAAENLAP